MTENEARAVIYNEIISNWTETPYSFDNEKFDSDDVPEWVRVSMRSSAGGQHTLGAVGGRRYRRRGLVFVQIFVPVDRGLQRFDELARAARDLYEGKTLSGVMFDDGNIRELGIDGSDFYGNVSVAFSFDETK